MISMFSVIVTVMLSIFTLVPLIMFVVGKFHFTFLIIFKYINITQIRFNRIILIASPSTYNMYNTFLAFCFERSK